MGQAQPRGPIVPRWFIFSALLISLVPALTVLLNLSPVRAAITQRIKLDTGLELGDIRIRLFPRLRITFSGAFARDDQHPAATIGAKRGEVTVRLVPLLRKRISVSKVALEEPHIVIVRDRTGIWRLPLFEETPPAADRSEPGGFRLHWLLPDCRLSGGTIVAIDEFERTQPYELRVTNVELVLDSHRLRKYADVTLTGNFDDPGKPSGLALAGALSIASLPDSSDSAQVLPPVRFEGLMKIRGFDLGPWIGATEYRHDQPWLTDVSAQTLIVPAGAGYDLTVSQVEARLDWLILRGKGRIQGLGSGHPAYSAEVSASPLRLAAAMEHVPTAWIEPTIRSLIAEYHLTGTLELVSGTVTGRLDRPEGTDWKGVVKVSEGSGVIRPGETPVRNVSATIFVDEPAHIEVIDLSGLLGSIRVASGKLVFSHLEVAPHLDLEATGGGRVTDLFDLLSHFQEASVDAALKNAIVDPGGEIRLSLHMAGPLAPNPRLDLIDTEITGHDLGMRVPAWNRTFEHLNGTVRITPRFVELKHLSWRMGPFRFDAQGALDTARTVRLEDVVVQLAVEGAEVNDFLAPDHALPSDVTLTGPATATIHLTGPLSSPNGKGVIDLTRMQIVVPPVVRKGQGETALVEFDGTAVFGNRWTVRRLALSLPAAVIEGRADVRLRRGPAFEVHLRGGPLSVTQLAGAFSISPEVEGSLKASVTVTGRGADWQTWESAGWVEISRGAVALEDLKDQVRDIALRLHLAGHDAMIDRLSCRVGDSDVTVRGTLKHWTSHPMPTLTVESSRLDVTRLIPDEDHPEERAHLLDELKQWAVSSRADVTVMIRQAHYRRLNLKQLSAHLHVRNGTIELDHLVGETAEGSISGQVSAVLKPREPLPIEGRFEFSGVPVQQVISLLEPEADPIRGSLSLAGRMQAIIDPTSHFVTSWGTTEPLRLRMDRGHIVQGRVLPKVLKLLNFPSILRGKVDLEHEGIPFEHISATVAIKDGLLESRDMVLDSPIMRVTATGQYDGPRDQLNVGLAVSSLGSYSDLMKSIPLFGKLLAGNRPGLDTALFEASGSWTDPQVRYLPIESIAMGLTGFPRLAIDVLLNTLALPANMVSPPSRDSSD